MTVFLIIKLVVVLVFLVMFLRRPSLPWGVGLLTVTSATLLDTLFGTFSRDEIEADFGFFFFIIAGLLVAGSIFWMLGLLWSKLPGEKSADALEAADREDHAPKLDVQAAFSADDSQSGVDRQMLYQEVRSRFGREDILDLAFDLDLQEADVMPVDQDMHRLIVNVMTLAEQNGQSNSLALAVERILTPPPADHLPRLERINAESPPAILRHYILANYTNADLKNACAVLEIDWEWLDSGSKLSKTRSLLQYLRRRNRMDELIRWMRAMGGLDEEE